MVRSKIFPSTNRLCINFIFTRHGPNQKKNNIHTPSIVLTIVFLLIWSMTCENKINAKPVSGRKYLGPNHEINKIYPREKSTDIKEIGSKEFVCFFLKMKNALTKIAMKMAAIITIDKSLVMKLGVIVSPR